MKHFNPHYKITLAMLFSFLVISCAKEDDLSPTNPDAADINSYIRGLNYDPTALLNVQETGGASSKRTLQDSSNTTNAPVQGSVLKCVNKDYSLANNFDDVAILRPTAGVVYPGSLVFGDQSMLDGAPNPITLPRAPMTLTVDLPGISEQGVFVVENPKNSTVQIGLDNALEWWNDNAYQDGYVNAANSSYQSATSYSSSQFSLDIGLNAQWATGSVAAQMGYESNSERRVAAIAFKQVFYTVTLDFPTSPADVFRSDVSLAAIEEAFQSDTPPAYINSVSYGRIIMVRMETTNFDYSVDLSAVLNYASGVNSGTGTVNSIYDNVLQNSTLNVVTIGGNAEVAVSAIDAASIEEGPGSLSAILSGENAIYSRDNPGVPIAYTVRYLKDNSLAKMGYTTEYRVEECGNNPFVHEDITVTNDSFHDTRFRFEYKGQDSSTQYFGAYVHLNQDDVVSRRPPNGAHDVTIRFESQIGAGDYDFIDDDDFNYVYSEACYEFYGGSPVSQASVREISCD